MPRIARFKTPELILHVMCRSVSREGANGSTKLKEIATKVGESTDKCAKYIKTLLELRILKKETATGEEGIDILALSKEEALFGE